jgi:hypothetical protein
VQLAGAGRVAGGEGIAVVLLGEADGSFAQVFDAWQKSDPPQFG